MYNTDGNRARRQEDRMDMKPGWQACALPLGHQTHAPSASRITLDLSSQNIDRQEDLKPTVSSSNKLRPARPLSCSSLRLYCNPSPHKHDSHGNRFWHILTAVVYNDSNISTAAAVNAHTRLVQLYNMFNNRAAVVVVGVAAEADASSLDSLLSTECTCRRREGGGGGRIVHRHHLTASLFFRINSASNEHRFPLLLRDER